MRVFWCELLTSGFKNWFQVKKSAIFAKIQKSSQNPKSGKWMIAMACVTHHSMQNQWFLFEDFGIYFLGLVLGQKSGISEKKA